MNISVKGCLTILALYQILAASGARIAAQAKGTQTDHVSRIKALSDQLRPPTDAGGQKHYMAIKDAVSKDLLNEIDAYIGDSFPANSNAAQIKVGLDAVLGYKNGDVERNVAFLTELPAGRFLIAGIELLGAGTTNLEGYGDSICFRAYSESDGKFIYVASTGELSNSALYGLNAETLKVPPIAGEFWFLAWADVPPLVPPKIAAQLYAFDGKSFRTVWEPDVFISSSVENAVQLTPDGLDFVVNRLPDFRSQTIVHEQYYLTADGPQKVREWTSERE
jgi:hypothetical protein